METEATLRRSQSTATTEAQTQGGKCSLVGDAGASGQEKVQGGGGD